MLHRSFPLVLLGVALAALPSSARALEFSPPAVKPLAGTPVDAVVADADADGDLDVALVVVGATERSLALLLNDGSGQLAGTATVGLSETPGGVAAGDLNGDGRPELLVLSPDAATVRWWSYDGSSLVGGGSVPLPGTRPTAIAVGDFSGDGLADAVVTDERSPGFVRLLRGDGSTLAPSPPAVAVGDFPAAVTTADFDGDGVLDFATADTGTLNVSVLLGNGTGAFVKPPGSPYFVGSLPNAVVSADFDEDGDPDLAVTNRGSNTVTVLLGDGSGGFTEAPGSPLAVGSQPESLATGDFDGDGRTDLATVVGGTRAAVLLGDGAGRFAHAVGSPFAVSGSPLGLVAGDLDGDGLDDLLVQLGSGAAAVTLLNASAPPASTTAPSVTGGTGAGETLTCDPGAWSGSAPLSHTYAWLRDGAPIPGADGPSHVVGDDDLGTALQCEVRASNELGSATAASAAVDVPAPPTVAFGAASAVTATGATLGGLVTPSLAETTWRFEYGTSDAYGASTPPLTLPAGRAPQAVTATLDGLEPQTTYHVRLVATNAAGTTVSGDATFTTAERPTVPPPVVPPGPPGVDVDAPPTVDVTARPPALGRGRDVTLSFAAAGAVGFECRLDGGAWVACASPFSLRGLIAGDHTLAVRATGADGRRGEATTIAFQVNPYPPGLTVRSAALRADRAGAAALRLTCSRREGEGRGACVGTVAVRRASGRGAPLARGSFRLRAGASATVRLRLTAAGRRALHTRHRARLPVRIAIRAHDLAGNRRLLSLRGTLR